MSLIYYDLHVWLWWWWSSRKESDLFRSKSLISKQRRNRSSSCWNFPMQGRSLLSASTAIKIKSNQPAIRETKGFFFGWNIHFCQARIRFRDWKIICFDTGGISLEDKKNFFHLLEYFPFSTHQKDLWSSHNQRGETFAFAFLHLLKHFFVAVTGWGCYFFEIDNWFRVYCNL